MSFVDTARSADWIVVAVNDSVDRPERTKHTLYKAVVRGLEERAGIRPSDVFVMLTVTPPADFSFADGVVGTEVEAAEPLDGAATGTRDAYTEAEMAHAVRRLFQNQDRGSILPMLSDDVVLRLPATLPYGGEFTGRAVFDEFFSKSPGGGAVWETFDVVVDDVIASDDHVIARLTNTAVPRATGKAVVFQNLWFFGVAGGRIVSAQLYADTAVVTRA
ncbi:tautomerase family protein [Asanoa sp. NPDC050611]|uniref:tautomerase family protein n=1 Tax=Asanoa sp. NPDC050611 TaxID=3157098 RepID=UPI00340FE042